MTQVRPYQPSVKFSRHLPCDPKGLVLPRLFKAKRFEPQPAKDVFAWHDKALNAAVIAVAKATKVKRQAIESNSRVHSVSHVRIAIYAAAASFGMSSPKIGDFFDRDHSTILQGIGRHDDLMQKPYYRVAYKAATTAIGKVAP